MTEASRVFISYSHFDSAAADEIASALGAAGMHPWIDKQEMTPGSSFVERMNMGIGEASYILVLFSKSSIDSHWVSREWMSALATRATIVIPVLLDDSPVPPLLRDIVYFDLRRNSKEGVRQIVDFFQRETEKLSTAPRIRGELLRSASRRQLRLVALRCLDEAGLRSFCFDAELDPASLTGTSLQERLLCLLHVVATEGLIRSFAEWIESERERCVRNQIAALQASPLWNWQVSG